MKIRHWFVAAALSALLFVSLCCTAAWLLIPPRYNYGCTWRSYLQEPRDSIDVLFFGSSLVYCDIIPSVIYQECGITSYLMAGPEQTIPVTYDYIKEACKTQTPSVIALEITGLFYPRYTDSDKPNVAYMPLLSNNRLEAAFQGASPDLRVGLLFPIWDYHSRWTEVTFQDMADRVRPGADLLAGYTFLHDSRAPGETAYRDEFRAEGETYLRNLEYLRRIEEFCEQRNIQLLLFISPTIHQIPPEVLTQAKEDLSVFSSAAFVDFNGYITALSIDNSTDWFDVLHLNYRGAVKVSRLFARYLSGELGLSSTQGESSSLWHSRIDALSASVRDAEEAA